MKNLIATALGLSLLVSGAAMAAPGNERGRGHDDRAHAGAPHYAPGKVASPAPRVEPPRGPVASYRTVPPRPGMRVVHAPPHHVAPPPRLGHPGTMVYRPGYRLPPHVRGIEVRDYRRHGLRKAPRGHEWRRLDGRYLMVAIATGVITEIVINGR